MSTEHQQYSPENQLEIIREYAAAHNMEIVQDYSDHGRSGLNIAECEFSVLSRQCTNRRIPDQQALIAATNAWVQERNHDTASVQWQFTTADARITLAHLCPVMKPSDSCVTGD